MAKLLDGLLNKLSSKSSKVTVSDDSSVNSLMIWNGQYNFIVLVSITKDYLQYAVELLSYKHNDVNIRFITSSYDEYVDDEEESEGNIEKKQLTDEELYEAHELTIIHNKYYLLIGCNDISFTKWINNFYILANPILDSILELIKQYRPMEAYNELITNLVIGADFRYQSTEPEWDKLKVYASHLQSGSDNIDCRDDEEVILSRLPKCFKLIDILDFIWFYSIDTTNKSAIWSFKATEKLRDICLHNDRFENIPEIRNFFIKLNPTYEEKSIYDNILGPKYMLFDYASQMAGDMSDEHLDELFREQIDRATYYLDNDVVFEDIDEELAFEEEEE